MKLTSEQQDIVIENSGLKGWYIKKHNLYGNLEEIESVLSLALVKSVLKHDPERGSLSTLFNLIAYREVGKLFRSNNKKDMVMFGSCVTSKLEFSNNGTLSNELGECDFILSEFVSELDDEQRRVVELIYQGYLKGDVADIMGVSKSKVSRIISSMEGKLLGGV